MPRRVTTPEMIAAARTRVAAGETLCAVARSLDVKRDALNYHLRGGKAVRYLRSPWTPHTKQAFRALSAGNHAEAAYHFTAAAKVLINL